MLFLSEQMFAICFCRQQVVRDMRQLARRLGPFISVFSDVYCFCFDVHVHVLFHFCCFVDHLGMVAICDMVEKDGAVYWSVTDDVFVIWWTDFISFSCFCLNLFRDSHVNRDTCCVVARRNQLGWTVFLKPNLMGFEISRGFYTRKQLLISAHLSHRNSVCHTGGSVRSGAS